ncbi:MAG: Rpn family recombination-promoting nuclease/putative transposase, partial [Saprospiraceae bacterium]
AVVQILYYLASSYFKQFHSEKKIELIIPLLYYQGKRKWKLKSIAELIPSLPKELQCFVPVFDTIFIDLNRFDEDQLTTIQNMFLLATLIAQMKNRDPDTIFVESLTVLSKSNVGEYWNLFESIVVYLFETTQFSDNKIHELLDKIPKPIKNKIMTTYDVIAKKYQQLGKKEGFEEGIEKNSTDVIIKGYKKGLSVDFLADITGLSLDKVREIIENDLKG